MTKNTLTVLQSLLITGQIINGGLASLHASPTVAVIVSAVLGGFQFYVHAATGSDVTETKKVQ